MRLDLALGVELDQFAIVLLACERVALGPGAPEDADNGAILEQREIERNTRNAGRKTDHQEAPFPGGRAQRGFGIVATDSVVDHIGTVGAAGFLEQRGEGFGAVLVERPGWIDHAGIGAMGLGQRQLLCGRDRRDNLGAHRLAELHRSETDTTGRA